jgi:hypothetical protein
MPIYAKIIPTYLKPQLVLRYYDSNARAWPGFDFEKDPQFVRLTDEDARLTADDAKGQTPLAMIHEGQITYVPPPRLTTPIVLEVNKFGRLDIAPFSPSTRPEWRRR